MANKNLTPRINRLEPNLVIDGGMEIWPEGTSRAILNNTSIYGSVLFKGQNNSTAITITNSRQNSAPSGTNLIYSNQLSKTVAGTLSASTFVLNTYFVEGYDLQRIYNQESSIIFWVKSSVASNRSVSLNAGGYSHVQQYAISQANTWELKALKLPAMNTNPGVLDRTSGLGLQINFGVVCGSTHQTSSLNQWLAGTFLSGIGEDTTWLTGTNHDFSIAGVMVLPGDWTSLTAAGYDFVRAGKNFQDEVAMSQRYYEKSYSSSVAPGTVLGNGLFEVYVAQALSNADIASVSFKVEKRTTPTVISYSPSTGAANRLRNLTSGADRIVYYSQVATSGYVLGYNDVTTGTNTLFGWQWAAEARF